MSILAPTRPAPRYGPMPYIGIAREADGFTATCQCGHLRWDADQKRAATEYAKHVKGCKSHRVEVAA